MRYLSVFSSDEEILKALSDIHLKGKWYDLDCTISTQDVQAKINQVLADNKIQANTVACNKIQENE